ncbi:MAG TPA: imelysin family protein, partial [Nevskiaceae bacterium]|nr:imelysin family protein [Nevskiaceae bacterium]
MSRVALELWASLTAIAATPSPAVALDPASTTVAPFLLAQGGEGGEADAMPSSYRLLSTDPTAFAYDGRPTAQNYADLVHASYARATDGARRVQAAIDALLDKPSKDTLAAARAAWVAARPAYLVTEAYRFYDGPIDLTYPDAQPGPEPRINAWPLNEAFIDYVKGQPKGGLVGDTSVPLSAESILSRDQVEDEADVTTGWHAIEFLLWGQDFSETGPGDRPASDYAKGSPTNERRRTYLATVTKQLVDDLAGLTAQWAPGADNYRKHFLAMDAREALGRALNGMANLAGHELATERLSVALDSGDQEDEHSCFSDTTHQDHVFDLRGVRNAWYGSLGDTPSPDSLRALVHKIDPKLADETDAVFARATSAADAMEAPFDQKILRAAAGSPGRQRAEAAITAFQ